jgi:3-hydroxymyristoyl/3-hydroxydecanoyl-(acyl carrier protein) dehydratase
MPASWPWAGFIPGRDGAETRQDTAESRFLLISEAPFLAGHFPGRPILPGVAIIDAALMACRAAAGARHLRLDAISAARFFAAVLPGDELTLCATPAGAGAWRATARANGVLCARMTLHVTEQAAAPRHAAAPRRPHFDVGAAEIALRLPQRPPMLMLEGAMHLPDGTWAMHGRPHMPAATPGGRGASYPTSLICEGFFQAAGCALQAADPDGAMLLGSIGRADFAAVPHASETVRHIVTSSRMLGDAALVAGQTRTEDDALVASYADVLVVVRRTEPRPARAPAGCS